MAKRVWPALGLGYGWQILNNTYDWLQVDKDFDYLWRLGFRRLRIYLPGSNASQTRLDNIKLLVAKAMAKGFYVRWGCCSEQAFPNLTATVWNTHKNFIINTLAPYAQSIGLPELIVGNEEELHCDGTTLTAATVRSDINAMATSIKSGGYTGKVAYDSSVGNGAVLGWAGTGIGANLDYVHFNFYDRLDNFRKTAIGIIRNLGAAKTGCSEFGWPQLTGLQGFQSWGDEQNCRFDVEQRIQCLKDCGFQRAYFFAYRDGPADGYTDAFALALSNGQYREAFKALINSGSS